MEEKYQPGCYFIEHPPRRKAFNMNYQHWDDTGDTDNYGCFILLSQNKNRITLLTGSPDIKNPWKPV